MSMERPACISRHLSGLGAHTIHPKTCFTVVFALSPRKLVILCMILSYLFSVRGSVHE